MNIDKNLFQTLAQQLQRQLEAQFIKNIRFFQAKIPNIANRFRDYNVEKVKLQLSSEGYLNLVNTTLNDKPVYAYDPQQFCQDYVDQFAKTPRSYTVHFKAKNILDEENVTSISVANRCHETLDGLPNRLENQPIEATTDTLILNGIGMGYLIPQLLELTDIHNLIVLEPHADVFHASLHILDWEQVFQHFEQDDHSIKLIVEESPRQSMGSLRKHFHHIGPHHFINALHIEHLSSKEMNDTLERFMKSAALELIPSGYFDDEQVSLAHSLHNWRSRIPPLREFSPIERRSVDKPLFLIGNGPSLDLAKDFLRQNQDKAIIVSCGTTLGSLRKMGIKPDIHIEMERTRPVVEWISTSTDEAYRKDILLLALNTVHPDVFKMFDLNGMGMKTNDLGTHFVSQYISEGCNAINLAHCNPTVGNAGMAFSVALGFKNIYLFGLDLGFSAGTQHHSTLSTHYNMDEKHQKGLHLYNVEDKGNKTVPANFGGTVTTTFVYMSAKNSIEFLIRFIPDLNCFNTSNGVLIEGAQPIQLNEIQLDTQIENKLGLIHELYEQHFYMDGLNSADNDQTITNTFKPAAKVLDDLAAILSIPATDWHKAQLSIDRLHRLTLALGLNDTTQYCYTLLKGSIFGFNVFLSRALYCGNTREEALDHFNKVRELVHEFTLLCKEKTENKLLTLDAKTRNLDKKVKG